MSKPIEKAFIIAWALGCCFYFMEYVVRSSPAVMIANLAARLQATPLVVSGILGAYYYTYSVTSLVRVWRSTGWAPNIRSPLG